MRIAVVMGVLLTWWPPLLSAVETCRAEAAADEREQGRAIDHPCPWGRDRLLGGHAFLFPSLFESSFVTTNLGSRIGVESLRIPDVPFAGAGPFDLSQIRVAESIDLGIKLSDRVGLFLTGSAFGVVSTSVSSLVIRGGEYVLRADGGVRVNVWRTARSQISVNGRAGGLTGNLFSLLPLIEELVAQPLATVEEVLTGSLGNLLIVPVSGFNVGGSATAAHAFESWLSAQAALAFTYRRTNLEPFDVGTDERTRLSRHEYVPVLGLAVAGDAEPLGFPLALMLEYRLSLRQISSDIAADPGSRTENIFAAGLYYTGRLDLQAGLIGFFQLGEDPIQGRSLTGEPAESGQPRNFGALFSMRYIW